MRQTISGLVAAIAVMTVSAAPAMACGAWEAPCYAPAYTYAGCNGGCSVHERLPDPVLQYGPQVYAGPQYYYVNQGPTFTGPGNYAPYRFYQEDSYRVPPVHYGRGPRHHGHREHVARRTY